MICKHIFITILLTGFLIISCGSGVSSPENLGVQVFMALRNNNVNSYLQLCGGVDEQLYLYNRSNMSKERRREDIKEMLENRKEFEKDIEHERQDNFRELQDEYDWKKFKIDHVELGEISEREGIKYYPHINVLFTNGRALEIDIVVNTQHGWKIMDDVPLSVE